jgi:hypothetical protein
LQALLRGDTRAKQTGSTGAHNHNVKGFHALSLVGVLLLLMFSGKESRGALACTGV